MLKLTSKEHGIPTRTRRRHLRLGTLAITLGRTLEIDYEQRLVAYIKFLEKVALDDFAEKLGL